MMEIVSTIADVRARVSSARAAGKSIGLVPTMGFFHEGHLTLFRTAAAECGYVVVSLFVNPTQFEPGEDFDAYPRDLDRDAAMAESAGVDLLFTPTPEEMYPEGDATWIEVGKLGEPLCGQFRPRHFRGVATVVAKLFNIALPDRAYFGEKDFQQIVVIRRMARDLQFPLAVVSVPTVREPDGLAMSSRNIHLASEERVAAQALSRALAAAQALFAAGETSASRLRAEAMRIIGEEPLARLQYAEIVDAEDLAAVETITRPAVLAVAALVGRTRLIDNTVLRPAGS
jgi:pantoate--beta-alanine ligase